MSDLNFENRHTPSRYLRPVIAVAIVSTFLGCPESTTHSPTPQSALLDSQCTADAECAEDEICIQGLCGVEPQDTEIEYGIVVRHSDRAVVPPQVLSPEIRPIVGAEAFAHQRSVISGELMTTDQEVAPDGTLVATGTDEPLLHQFQRPVRGGAFELYLPPGSYELTYIVDDERWPRIPLDTHDLSDESASLQLTMPTFEELRTVSGVLTRDVLDPLDILTEPIEGAEVVARASQSGHRSQVAVTDEEGEFELHLPPDDDIFDILVSPGPDNHLVPTATFSGEIDADTDEISVSVGELELELITLTVEITAQSLADHNPDWEDYRIDIERPLDIGDLLIALSGEEDGVIDVELLPGLYDIEITPPAGAPWAGASDNIDLLDALSTVEIELPLRTRVQGTVTDDDGEPVANSRLHVISSHNRNIVYPDAYTDENGHYQLWLDPGEYELSVYPPVSRGLPVDGRQLTISSGDTDVTQDIELRRGFVTTGQLQTSEGTPLSHASIELFHEQDETYRTLGYDITDSDGTYRVFIPLP